MTNECGRIRIVPSDKLTDLKLSELEGRTGMVIENLTCSERKNKGYMVRLDVPFFRRTNLVYTY
ncbi:hypothetical protein CLV62_1523 [Dysgonomonas alginatilytica]|uniref:Uncharacterized protein n=1 Tax=Dysgonomonas alginatilytica TaxID=1605892 RepID=A0A2V3PJ87_9BACT|nr:hypothetical protein [Dysgonomonas alginatilytica]PXV57419.1 hypothetical protein CLV62_1523 [Dysgonomonas alginatilytica]